MTNIIKKYWFVFLLALCFIGVTVFYTYDTNKDKLPGKKVNGKDVVYSINNIDITADELYDELYSDYGIGILYSQLEKEIANQSIETTEEMKTNAKLSAQSIITNFQQTYGATYEEQLLTALRQAGYSNVEDLETYLIQSEKIRLIYEEYIEKNADVTSLKYIEELKPRVVSHILVTMKDVNNPSAEELAKVKEIEDALSSGKDFKEVATEFSDDSSAADGGNLGYVDANTSFVPEFLEAMLTLNEGEVTSEWVHSQYGYHLIKADATTLETLKLLPEFITGLNSYDPTIQPKAIWEKAQELQINFGENTELEKQLKDYLGISE